MCDYSEQKPDEHDFTYASRILKAASDKFSYMLVNGSYSLADLRRIKKKVLEVIIKECGKIED